MPERLKLGDDRRPSSALRVIGTAEKSSEPKPDGNRGYEMNADILAVLKEVIDPELGTNIVDLGLVYHAAFNARGIDIALTMTTPACPLGEMMSEEIKAVLRRRFPATPDVRVELVWDPPWSPDMMSEEARRQLGMS
jgi:metal-sulfur cluster biosynthetic enzyme